MKCEFFLEEQKVLDLFLSEGRFYFCPLNEISMRFSWITFFQLAYAVCFLSQRRMLLLFQCSEDAVLSYVST